MRGERNKSISLLCVAKGMIEGGKNHRKVRDKKKAGVVLGCCMGERDMCLMLRHGRGRSSFKVDDVPRPDGGRTRRSDTLCFVFAFASRVRRSKQPRDDWKPCIVDILPCCLEGAF